MGKEWNLTDAAAAKHKFALKTHGAAAAAASANDRLVFVRAVNENIAFDVSGRATEHT